MVVNQCPSQQWGTFLHCLVCILTFTSSCSLCPSHWWLMTKEDNVTVGRGPADPASPQTPGQLLTPMSPKVARFLRLWTWGLRGFQQLKPLSPAPSTPALHSAEPVQGPEARPGPVETPLRPGGGQPPVGPRSGPAPPKLTAAPRLRVEPPVGREVSHSSWHGLIEQSGFVSVDSCSHGAGSGLGVGVGRGAGFGKMWGEAKASSICSEWFMERIMAIRFWRSFLES